METIKYPKMLYKDGAFSSEQADQLTVANEEEEAAAFEHGFCQLIPVDKSAPKDAKAIVAGKAKAAGNGKK